MFSPPGVAMSLDEDPVQTSTGAFAMVPLWLPQALRANKPKAAGTALIVWIALHRWTAGNDRSCYPSGQSIADEAGVSLSTCREALKLLRDVGALSWEQRRSVEGDLTSNAYMLHLDDPARRSTYTGQPVNPAPASRSTGTPASRSVTRPSLKPDPGEPDKPSSSAPPTRGAVDAEFEVWWALYPKKATGKGQARERWRKMTKADRVDAFEAIRRHAAWWAEHGTDATFIPAGNVWLNQRRWEDDEPRSATPLTVVKPMGKMERVRAALDAGDKTKTETKAEAR